MSDPTTNEIREMLERAVSESPAPHPWGDIERRAGTHDAAPSQTPRRIAIWLAAAAVTIALVAGFMVAIDPDDDPRIDDAPVPASTAPATTDPETTAGPTTTATPTTTDAPPTTTDAPPAVESGWSGGLLDDLDTEALRPLDAYTEGDVIIPTAPGGWRVSEADASSPGDQSTVRSNITIIEAQSVTIPVEPVPTDGQPTDPAGQRIILTLTGNAACEDTRGCSPSGPPVTINGIEWQSFAADDEPNTVPYSGVRAGVGDLWIWVTAPVITGYQSSGDEQFLGGFDDTMLEEPTMIEFLEGLRVGAPEVLAAIGEACWQCDVAGAEGDPFAAGSPAVAPAVTSDAQPPSDDASETGRPLTELATGDVVVATYIPPGLALQGEAQIYGGPTQREFSFQLGSADEPYSTGVRLWENGPWDPDLDDPNHPPVEIAGLTWGWIEFEQARTARVGTSDVWVYLRGLDRTHAERFIEGLRAVSPEQYPGPIAVDGPDGLSVINAPADAELVASDERFELTAVRSGAQVCIKLEDTSVPPTISFAANCYDAEMFAKSTIVDRYPIDSPLPPDPLVDETNHLIIGVIDSPSATAVRLVSPAGESVVAPTGPSSQAIEGRFFLARLVVNFSDAMRLTMEDASS